MGQCKSQYCMNSQTSVSDDAAAFEVEHKQTAKQSSDISLPTFQKSQRQNSMNGFASTGATTVGTASLTQLGRSVSTNGQRNAISFVAFKKQPSYECDNGDLPGGDDSMSQASCVDRSYHAVPIATALTIAQTKATIESMWIIPEQENIQDRSLRRGTVNVFYATTEGTSSEYAEEFIGDCEKAGFYTRLIHIEKFEAKMLVDCTVAIFFVSSFGTNAGPTSDLLQFYLWLNNFENEHRPLRNLYYAVFGIYNSSIKRPTVLINETEEAIATMGSGHNAFSGRLIQSDVDVTDSLRLQRALTKHPVKMKSIGQKIDIVLEEVSAKRFFPLKQIDSKNKESGEKIFADYSERLLKKLKDKFPYISQGDCFKSTLPFQIDLTIPRHDEQNDGAAHGSDEKAQKYNESMNEYFDSREVKVSRIDHHHSEPSSDISEAQHTSPSHQVKNRDVSFASSETYTPKRQAIALQEYLLMTFDLTNSFNQQQFSAGDMVSVYPENDRGSVEQVCGILNVPSNSVMRISRRPDVAYLEECSLAEFKLPLPESVTVEKFLRCFVDLHGPLDQKVLYEIAYFAKDPAETVRLRRLSRFASRHTFNTHADKTCASLFSVIVSYHIQLPLRVLVGLFKPIQPRFYAIASSSLATPNKLELTVSLHRQQRQPQLSKQHTLNEFENDINFHSGFSRATTLLPAYGLTSQYFWDIYEGIQYNHAKQHVRMKFIERKRYVFTEDIGCRVILITQDEGVAFVSAYLQEIEAMKNIKNIDVHLFNANRLLQLKSNGGGEAGGVSYLHKSRINKCLKSKILKTLSTVLMTNHRQAETGGPPLHANESIITLPELLRSTQLSNQNASPVSLLIESQLDRFTELLRGIEETNSSHQQVKIYISGSQIMSHAVFGVIVKAYSRLSGLDRYAAFNSVLELESEGKITRVVWTNNLR